MNSKNTQYSAMTVLKYLKIILLSSSFPLPFLLCFKKQENHLQAGIFGIPYHTFITSLSHLGSETLQSFRDIWYRTLAHCPGSDQDHNRLDKHGRWERILHPFLWRRWTVASGVWSLWHEDPVPPSGRRLPAFSMDGNRHDSWRRSLHDGPNGLKPFPRK